jgi:uncharacterized protein DUF3558
MRRSTAMPDQTTGGRQGITSKADHAQHHGMNQDHAVIDALRRLRKVDLVQIRSFLPLLFAGLAALALTACGGSTGGQATPVPLSSSSTEPMLAPRVSQPLTNTARYETDPCSAATISEIEKLGGAVGGTKVYEAIPGKTCQWDFSNGSGNVGGAFITGNKRGLNSLYVEHQAGRLTTFQPVAPVEGYPAVVYSQGDEGPGTCSLAVGVRDELTYTVITHLRAGNPALADPCKMATQLSEMVINRLKAS